MKTNTQQFSPADLNTPDSTRLEKKRERNREAAQKCRQRKLEKIAALEAEVSNLRNENQIISDSSIKLKAEIESLMSLIKEHQHNFGCELSEIENAFKHSS